MFTPASLYSMVFPAGTLTVLVTFLPAASVKVIVKVAVAGSAEPLWSVGEGNGPVNALDQALRRDLGRYQKHIKDVELVDYKVRILTGGTEAVTRVLVESHDKRTGERWSTVGVSPNIIDASFEALTDSFTYKLLKGMAKPGDLERTW